jgi:hypothetical protein
MKMKQHIVLLTLCFFFTATISAQLVSSGKSSILLNNKEVPPVIELTSLKMGPDKVVVWEEKNILLEGKINSINKKLSLFINNNEIAVNEFGAFSFEQPLTKGTNDISMKAISGSNMSAEVSFKVDYRPDFLASISEEDGKFYALIIGINNYQDPGVTELDNPIKDAQSFFNTITSRYTFDKLNVKFLKNATMAEIVDALDYYAKTVRPIDNFLIFYAGHGVWDKSSEIGFWLPSDAKKDSKLAWFRNSTLRDYLREIHSKHTLLITDACFGGSIFKTRAAFIDAPLAVNKLYELPSRKAMTSGNLTAVPDQSAFLKYMIDRLDKNSDKYLSSEQLFSSFRIAVINNSNVIPQFGEIKDVGDEGGDFIFILKK